MRLSGTLSIYISIFILTMFIFAPLFLNLVVFRMPLDRVETKLKLSQNRDLEDRTRVIARLEAGDNQDAQATAKWMKRVLP